MIFSKKNIQLHVFSVNRQVVPHSSQNGAEYPQNLLISTTIPLLLLEAMTVPFWVLCVIAGTTDMLDGFLARRWGVESKFGARLDMSPIH